MQIILKDIQISFYQKRILKNINFTFEHGGVFAITGANGSGKSTVVKLIAGTLQASKGKITYLENNTEIDPNNFHKHLSWVAPYINIYEELNATETYSLQATFKKPKYSIEDFLTKTHLTEHRNKRIKYYSSGMKQRLKLALALFFESDLLLLDEPTVNLDKNFQDWYNEHINQIIAEKNCTIIIASNEPNEYKMAHQVLDLELYR